MELIVDLHTHSRYSRATSANMNLVSLYKWAKIKGINVLGTGDFTHPIWFADIKSKLEPAETGLLKLKDELAKPIDEALPEILRKQTMRFILTSEISNIYSKKGKVRKIHNLVVAPGFETVEKINQKLTRIGNLMSDGRPILGMDSKELLRITLNTDPQILFIPAHAWTPWFSIFGSRSGFDSIEEAFEELNPHIHAIETGLSSDPFMNWRLSVLDGITLVSNSDAHSPIKLGREANIINSELNYGELAGAINTNDGRMLGTIEFFPEEGKYHWNGHRICEVVMSPEESRKINNICPKCGKELVLGVEHRVEMLADRKPEEIPAKHKKVEYIIPLTEIIAQIKQVKSSQTRGVIEEYLNITETLGNEFSILRKIATEEIKKVGFNQLARAIEALRQGKVVKQPGYDGVFGIIKVVMEDKNPENLEQLGFGW